MPTLPWTPTAAPSGPADVDTAVVVFGSRLELRSYRSIPAFLRAALQLRRQVHHAPGALGISLIAQPMHKTFWTLSAWTDDDAMESFVRTTTHQEVMRRFHDRLAGTAFASFRHPVASLPKPHSNAKDLWRDAKEHLGATRTGGM